MMQLDGVLELDVLLPSQYFGRRRKNAPEHRLMMAVIQDAFEVILKHRFASDVHNRRLYDETALWFLARDTEWPYSFECICTELDLDSDAVRERLGVVPAEIPDDPRDGGPAVHRHPESSREQSRHADNRLSKPGHPGAPHVPH